MNQETLLIANTSFLALTIIGKIINDKTQNKGIEFCLLTLIVTWKIVLGNGITVDLTV